MFYKFISFPFFPFSWFSCLTSVSFWGWQVEGVSYLDQSLKLDRPKKKSTSKDASAETHLDGQPSVVKSNETEANEEDESGLANNINQDANIMV